MTKRVLYIGLDVDDNKFHGYCICEGTGEIFPFIKGFQLLVVMENNKKIGPFPKISSLNTWQIYPYQKFFAIKRSADRKPTASVLSTNATLKACLSAGASGGKESKV